MTCPNMSSNERSIERFVPEYADARLARIIHDTTLFCTSCELTRADGPSDVIGVKATRDAARWGLICHVGGSSGHTAPRPMGLTA